MVYIILYSLELYRIFLQLFLQRFIKEFNYYIFMKKKNITNGLHPEIMENLQNIKQGSKSLWNARGTFKFKKSTQQMMDEIDE